MRCVVQRVSRAAVEVDGDRIASIEHGLLVLVGVATGDAQADVDYTASKLCGLRVFQDAAGKMNLSVGDVAGALLLVSQFTLLGDVRKGRRPAFDEAETPERADALYRSLIEACRALGVRVETGRFQAHMHVHLTNEGPVTILLDSRRAF